MVEIGRFRGDNPAPFQIFRATLSTLPMKQMTWLIVVWYVSLSGLREDIKNSGLIHRPKTYEETLDLAHIHEGRIKLKNGMSDSPLLKPHPCYPLLIPHRHPSLLNPRIPSPQLRLALIHQIVHLSNDYLTLNYRVVVSVDCAIIAKRNTLRVINVRHPLNLFCLLMVPI